MNVATEVSTGRRIRRSGDRHEAIWLQLAHVANLYSLDAITLSDDLGNCVAWAGSEELAELLADATLWSTEGFDEFTLAHLRAHSPDTGLGDVAMWNVDVPHLGHVIAVGDTPRRRAAVRRASRGVARICRGTFGAGDGVDLPHVQPRDSGVRWQIFTH